MQEPRTILCAASTALALLDVVSSPCSGVEEIDHFFVRDGRLYHSYRIELRVNRFEPQFLGIVLRILLSISIELNGPTPAVV